MSLQHATVYGDTQRLNQTYSVRFSLKKGELRCVWDPCQPPNREAIESLAAPYLDARDGFMLHVSDRLKRRIVAMSTAELTAIVRMHKAGMVTPLFFVGCDVAVLDPVNVHRGPMIFMDKQYG